MCLATCTRTQGLDSVSCAEAQTIVFIHLYKNTRSGLHIVSTGFRTRESNTRNSPQYHAWEAQTEGAVNCSFLYKGETTWSRKAKVHKTEANRAVVLLY